MPVQHRSRIVLYRQRDQPLDLSERLGLSRDPIEQLKLMKTPTTLHLTDERLISRDPKFQRLMTDLQKSPYR